MVKKITHSVGLAAVFVFYLSPVVFAGNFVFTSDAYLKLTKQVIREANVTAPIIFGSTGSLIGKYETAQVELEGIIDEAQKKRIHKKVTPQTVDDTQDKRFADALNKFNEFINLMSDQSHKPLSELLPSFDRWTRMETAVVKTGLDQRLAAYQTRFGPESEPINILEFGLSQKFLAGDESGPSPWEPILRFSAVQITSQGSGLTSGFQMGMNHYFLGGKAPKPLSLIGISNHVGVAAVVQYLEDPGAFNFKGRPSFGLVLHLDRKEAGLIWDDQEDRLRVTVGYAFQFIPLVF